MMVKAQAKETASRMRVVIGRDLARHEGVEQNTIGTGFRERRLLNHDRIGAAAAALALVEFVTTKLVTPPSQASAKAEGTAFDVPRPRHAMAAPPEIASLDAIKAVEMRHHDTGRANRELGHTLPDDARANRRALLIARATAQRQPLGQTGLRRGMARQFSDNARRLFDRRQAVPVDAAELQDPVAPIKRADVHHAVERQGRRISGPLIRAKAVQEIFLTIREPSRPFEGRGLVITHPGNFSRRPKRAQLHASMGLMIFRRDGGCENLLIFERTATIPDPGIPERLLVAIKRGKRTALARQPNRTIGLLRQVSHRHRLARRAANAFPDRFEILLVPARIGRRAGIFLIALPD